VKLEKEVSCESSSRRRINSFAFRAKRTFAERLQKVPHGLPALYGSDATPPTVPALEHARQR